MGYQPRQVASNLATNWIFGQEHKEIEGVTFEDEKDKEGEVVASFGGVADMIKETKMIVGT